MSADPVPVDAPLALLVNLQTASVPGFAPLGASGEHHGSWHWCAEPLPEVLIDDASRNPTVTSPLDFIRELTLERFDATELARLAVALGAGELVAISRDIDGVAFFDAPWGPLAGRDIVSELADAAKTFGLGFGLAHRADAQIGEVAQLIERYRPTSLRALPPTPAVDGLAGLTPEWATWATVARSLPNDPPPDPWELRRGSGPSLGWNRAETTAELWSARQLIELWCSTLAIGGRLLLDLPLLPDGSVAVLHRRVIEMFGRWSQANVTHLTGCGPFDVFGDDSVRYLARPGPEPGQRTVVIVDLSTQTRRTIAHFSTHRYPIISVDGAVDWHQDGDGLTFSNMPRLVSDDGRAEPVVLTVVVKDRRRVTLTVQGRRTPGTVTLDGVEHATITEALAHAQPCQEVAVGPGRFGSEHETYPLQIPAGVTLHGPRPTLLELALRHAGMKPVADAPTAELTGSGPIIEIVGEGGAVDHLNIVAQGGNTNRAVVRLLADRTRFESCWTTGGVEVANADEVTVAWNHVEKGTLAVHDASNVGLLGNRIDHPGAGQPAITMRGGRSPRIDGNTVTDATIGIEVATTVDARLSGNAVFAQHTGIKLTGATECEVSANRLTAMRAIHVAGGSANEVNANAIEHADTALLIDGGADRVSASMNRVADARIGILIWEAGSVTLDANRLRACRDHPIITGRDTSNAI